MASILNEEMTMNRLISSLDVRIELVAKVFGATVCRRSLKFNGSLFNKASEGETTSRVEETKEWVELSLNENESHLVGMLLINEGRINRLSVNDGA